MKYQYTSCLKLSYSVILFYVATVRVQQRKINGSIQQERSIRFLSLFHGRTSKGIDGTGLAAIVTGFKYATTALLSNLLCPACM